jgi:hypothetical protein
MQGAVQNLHHINVANYGMTDYRGPPEVRNQIRLMARTINPRIDNNLLVMHQDLVLAGAYTYPNVGLAQSVPEHGQTIFPVGIALSFYACSQREISS